MQVVYKELDIKKIQVFLPHRYPFLFVDYIDEIAVPDGIDPTDETPKSRVGIEVRGYKNVSINEPFFQGHFPGAPVMPGVLILETFAQIASFSLYPTALKKMESGEEKYQCVLIGADEARFRVPVVPGDTLRVHSKVSNCRSSLWTFECQGTVRDKVVAEAKILANLIPLSRGRAIF